MRYRIGLDIGIASVGWGIVDEENKIIDAGVRLFPEAKSDENQKRRARRSARRLLRRRLHRLERLKKLLFEYKIIDNIDYDFYTNETTPYKLRKKALYEKISDKELAVVLFHLVKRRGIQEFSLDNTSDKDDESTKNILLKNEKELENRYLCEVQIERMEKNGRLRGIDNNFKTLDYEKEARKILTTQAEYNRNITEDFIEKYIEILTKRRNYYEGPGKESIYSWKNEEEWMNKLVGNCTYFPEELRMVKNSFTAEKFNLLNDLNNLTIKREENPKLSKEEKIGIIEIFKQQKSVSLKKIAMFLSVKENDITGYRIDKNEKAIFTPLESYIEINKYFSCNDGEILDEISKIATYYQEKTSRKKYLLEIFKNNKIEISNENLEKLSELKYTGTHSLSKKAMSLIMEELLETSKNQIELFAEKGLVPYKMNFKGKKRIPKEYLDKWILSPVVKRSMGQAINIINKILEIYGTPEEIVIELARDKNSDEEKLRISKNQRKNEKENKKIREILGQQKLDKKYFQLLKYWNMQDGICMYSGEKISISDLINNPLAYEIDHIIPRSVSFDDSQDNKVLVKRIENQNKGQRSPYEYFSSGISQRVYSDFKAQVLDMYKNKQISMKKRDNLLFENEVTKYTNTFIARNLVDTRYSTRELSNLLKRFFIDNGKQVKIKAIRGSFTNQVRKQWGLTKMRDISHVHHAQDALIILISEKILNKLKWIREYGKEDKIMMHIGTGEILTDSQFKELFNYKFGKEIENYTGYKFSHFVDKKPNRQLMNETIYSTRKYIEINSKGKEEEKEYVIGKISGIYDKDSKVCSKFFEKEEKYSDLLMYRNDYKTFEKFLKVYEAYKNEAKNKKVNPFYLYYEEHGKYITKYSKKDNGPVVMELKYKSNELGNHLDITHKYKNSKKRVIMDTIPTYRMDVYFDGKVYKFISVRYLMLLDRGNFYEIDTKKYSVEKEKKGIDSKFEFKFSIFSGDILEIENKKGIIEKLKFKGVNDDKTNKIEADYISKSFGNYIENIRLLEKELKNNPNYKICEKMSLLQNEKLSEKESRELLNSIPKSSKQKFITIGKDIVKVRKIYVDILGREYDSVEKFSSIIEK